MNNEYKLIPYLTINADIVNECVTLCNSGADEITLIDNSNNDATHDANIDLIKHVLDSIDIPVIIIGNVKRFEDIKKYLYAGAAKVILDSKIEANINVIKEAGDRFGYEKLILKAYVDNYSDVASCAKNYGISTLAMDSTTFDNNKGDILNDFSILINDFSVKNIPAINYSGNIYGYLVDYNILDNKDMTEYKKLMINLNVPVKWYESSIKFDDFKLNSDGHIPVVVQDYKTNEVLMVAYMNKEAFNMTISTGKMTYFSRSRQELWIKGLTSGHFQYVKSLNLDCDNDTLLAKVYQVGSACHTGNYSCFFNEILKKDYNNTNPLVIFNDVYNVIMDRKIHPKEGSYTNYLFDKGIDKILKKVGEEATEIIIAAKNPNPEEIKYEISDFLYHVMVLMAERGVSWDDITKELARR